MLVSDKWNPRLWLREWLNAPSRNDREQSERIRAGMRKVFADWHAERITATAGAQEVAETVRSTIQSGIRDSLATDRTSAHPALLRHAPVVQGPPEEALGSPR